MVSTMVLRWCRVFLHPQHVSTSIYPERLLGGVQETGRNPGVSGCGYPITPYPPIAQGDCASPPPQETGGRGTPLQPIETDAKRKMRTDPKTGLPVFGSPAQSDELLVGYMGNPTTKTRKSQKAKEPDGWEPPRRILSSSGVFLPPVRKVATPLKGILRYEGLEPLAGSNLCTIPVLCWASPLPLFTGCSLLINLPWVWLWLHSSPCGLANDRCGFPEYCNETNCTLYNMFNV